jgi:plasmid stability protein
MHGILLIYKKAGAAMPILHVRNVPQELYEQIQRRAELEQRSLSAEVVNLLRAALDQAERPQARILEGIRRRRFYRPADFGAPDSVVLLREDRER